MGKRLSKSLKALAPRIPDGLERRNRVVGVLPHVCNFDFVPASNLGIIAREYEQMQFMNLLKTLGPDSPVVPMVLKAIMEHSSLSNREEMIQQQL